LSITHDRKADVIKTYATKSGHGFAGKCTVAESFRKRINNLTEALQDHVKDTLPTLDCSSSCISVDSLLNLVAPRNVTADFIDRAAGYSPLRLLCVA